MMQDANISSKLFHTETFTAHGYEVKIYHMKDADLCDRVKITPLDLYHPELTSMDGDLTINFQGSFFVSDIDRIKECLDDVEKLNKELKKQKNINCAT